MRNFIIFAAGLFLVAGACAAHAEPSAEASATIHAPIETVWEYNSHDDYAVYWSAFFAKFGQCPTADCPENATKRPSDIGYTRRCYRNADGSGLYWDETTVAVSKKPNRYYKRILAHDFHGYISKLYQKSWQMSVEQIYEAVTPQTTKLIFRTSVIPFRELGCFHDKDPSNDIHHWQYLLWKGLFVVAAERRVQSLFAKNLANIKFDIEHGNSDHPVYPYKKFCDSNKWWCPKSVSDY